MGELSDRDYIHHAIVEEWSLCQAFYFAHGLMPPEKDEPFQKLKDRFPEPSDTRGMFWMLERVEEDCWPKTPAEWLTHFWGFGVPPVDAWRAIFPYSETESMGSMLNRELDYRQFVHHFLRDLELPLEQLIYFAIEARPDRTSLQKQKAFDRILRHMEPMLRTHGGYAKADGGIRQWQVKPNLFFDLFQTSERPGKKCAKWLDWWHEHPVLAEWLQSKEGRYAVVLGDAADGSERQQPRSRTSHPLRELIAEIYYELDDPTNDQVWSRLSVLASSEQSFHPILDEVTEDEIHWHDGNEPKVMSRKTFQTFMAELRGGTSPYCRDN